MLDAGFVAVNKGLLEVVVLLDIFEVFEVFEVFKVFEMFVVDVAESRLDADGIAVESEAINRIALVVFLLDMPDVGASVSAEPRFNASSVAVKGGPTNWGFL